MVHNYLGEGLYPLKTFNWLHYNYNCDYHLCVYFEL